MKTVLKLAAVACLVSLGACNRTPAENNAANVEQSFENVADNMEAMASNTSNDQAADALNNRAEQVRDAGDNAADAIRDRPATATMSNPTRSACKSGLSGPEH